jgi:hypothetical protein
MGVVHPRLVVAGCLSKDAPNEEVGEERKANIRKRMAF